MNQLVHGKPNHNDCQPLQKQCLADSADSSDAQNIMRYIFNISIFTFLWLVNLDAIISIREVEMIAHQQTDQSIASGFELEEGLPKYSAEQLPSYESAS